MPDKYGSNTETASAIVVGGGPAGLTAAITLAAGGIADGRQLVAGWEPDQTRAVSISRSFRSFSRMPSIRPFR